MANRTYFTAAAGEQSILHCCWRTEHTSLLLAFMSFSTGRHYFYITFYSSGRDKSVIISVFLPVIVVIIMRVMIICCLHMHVYNKKGCCMGKPEGNRLLGKSRRRWNDNIKVDHQEVGCGDIDWIELVQDGDMWWALVHAVMNFHVP
jgi:hypothetical protein